MTRRQATGVLLRRLPDKTNLDRNDIMITRSKTLLAAAAFLSLGAAACTEAEKDQTEANTEAAADRTGDAASEAGANLKEEAQQVGSAIAAGAREAGQEIDEATDRMAVEADEQKAETQADTRGN